MSATAPITWTNGLKVTHGILNTEIRDALNDLRDVDGVVRQSRIPGVPISGTPTAGQVPTATSGTAAEWASPIPPGAGIPVNLLTTKGDLVAASGVSTPVRVAVGVDGQMMLADSTQAAGVGWQGVPVRNTLSYTGFIAVGPGKSKVYNNEGRALTITSVRASVNTAPTGAAIIVDVTKNGTSIYTTQTNRPTIAIDGTTAVGGTPDLTWAAGEYIIIDVDQVGSTIAGADLTVQVSAR